MKREQKKPPINISELTDKKGEAEKGSLSYVRQKGNNNPNGKRPHINWTQVLLSCVISLILAVIIILQVAPSKGSISDLAVGMDELSGQITSVSDKLNTEVIRIDTAVSAAASIASKYVDMDELSIELSKLRKGLSFNSLVSADEFSNLSGDVDNLSNLVNYYANLAVQLRLDLDETEIWSDMTELKKSTDTLDAGITFLIGEITKLENRVKKLEK